MSLLLFRLHRCGPLVRGQLPLCRKSIYNCNYIEPTYAMLNSSAIKQSKRPTSNMPPPPPPKPPKPEEPTKKKTSEPEYVLTFKPDQLKTTIKQFYSVYGPLFLVCHIGIGLTSLGFFCSLVWLNVDLHQLVPEVFTTYVGAVGAHMAGSGGKFVIAYAIHKALLPFRLLLAITLTKSLSPRFQLLKNKIFGKKQS